VEDVEKYKQLSRCSRLGDKLVEEGLISQKQLGIALDYQEQFGGKLGEIVILLGFVAKPDVAKALKLTEHEKLPIGEMLLKNGDITPGQLEKALIIQKTSNSLIGDILLSLKYVTTDILYKQLAIQKQMGRIGRQTNFKDARQLPFELAKRYSCVIVHDQINRYLLAVTEYLSERQIKDIERLMGKSVEMILVSQLELDLYWNRVYSQDMVEESVFKLARQNPENSAVRTFTWPQICGFVLLALIASACILKFGFVALIVINYIIQSAYLILILFKMVIVWEGASKNTQIHITQEELDSIDERLLPVYTILLPLYRESNIARKLLSNVEKLDYPKSKLDVRLLLEENDRELIETIRGLNLPSYYSTLIIPECHPKTKPKACNYGLIHARGEYVVIYDAEDKPEPDQLKKVYLAFKKLPGNTICIQSKLNYYNSIQNILTKWFTQEYSMWFEILLPGVMRLNIPIPLGGTSNHFKTAYLREIGAWDPFNVTEDADLGIRLYKEGYLTAIIDSRTYEEANSRLGNWIRQRSRWCKGYMQTWLVNMRHPIKLLKELKLRGFLGFQATVLGMFLPLLINPILWILMVLWFAVSPHWMQLMFSGTVYYFSLFLLIAGNFFFVYSGVVGIYWFIGDITDKDKNYTISFAIVKYALLMPLYWLLMSAACYKALWQLIYNPFHWEKTEHGLTSKHHEILGEEENS
jgi:cellulose synthase/poly-beta-1,6-N-acetylglucosamine synthase-like glycosyltransferase